MCKNIRTIEDGYEAGSWTYATKESAIRAGQKAVEKAFAGRFEKDMCNMRIVAVEVPLTKAQKAKCITPWPLDPVVRYTPVFSCFTNPQPAVNLARMGYFASA